MLRIVLGPFKAYVVLAFVGAHIYFGSLVHPRYHDTSVVAQLLIGYFISIPILGIGAVLQRYCGLAGAARWTLVFLSVGVILGWSLTTKLAR